MSMTTTDALRALIEAFDGCFYGSRGDYHCDVEDRPKFDAAMETARASLLSRAPGTAATVMHVTDASVDLTGALPKVTCTKCGGAVTMRAGSFKCCEGGGSVEWVEPEPGRSGGFVEQEPYDTGFSAEGLTSSHTWAGVSAYSFGLYLPAPSEPATPSTTTADR